MQLSKEKAMGDRAYTIELSSKRQVVNYMYLQ